MRYDIESIDMRPTGFTRGPIAMGALALGVRDTFTTETGGIVYGPGVVSVWRFASGRVVGQVERAGGRFENLPTADGTPAVSAVIA